MEKFDVNDADVQLDTAGLNCPMPLLKTKQALNKMSPGATLSVKATDPGSIRDFKSFVDLSSNKLLGSFVEQEEYYYLILKGG